MENIGILTHFEEIVHAKGITIFKLKEAERNVFFPNYHNLSAVYILQMKI